MLISQRLKAGQSSGCVVCRKEMEQQQAPLVLVDMGYLLFYRYHATSRYLRHSGAAAAGGGEVPVQPEMFAKHLRQQLRDLSARFPGCGPLVVCSDAPRATLWRKELYPKYKDGRKAAPAELSVLAAAFLEVVRERGDVLVEMPAMEADDLAYLVLRAAKARWPDRPVAIVTNDRDYMQLTAFFGSVRIFDATCKPVTPSSGDALHDFRMKLLTGDRSDNIPGACTKPVAERLVAQAAAEGVWPPAEVLDKWPAAKQDKLEFNARMMDMRRIPSYLAAHFQDQVLPDVWAKLPAIEN